MPPLSTPASRLEAIAQARHNVMDHGGAVLPWVAPWVVQSWQRCLSLGLRAQQTVSFEQISAQQLQRTLDANHSLISAAKPILEHLGRAIANTRYFAILTNNAGVVVDASGVIDQHDRRAHLISRVGADLSERAIGTTAIGSALADLHSVWLHRGEHFFDTTSVYSCAGAPLFGPNGVCVGMLDVTGIEAVERPELKHLVTQSACRIENALLLALDHALLLRLNWPGNAMGGDADGLVCLNATGHVTGANRVARQLLPELAKPNPQGLHVSDIFGVAVDLLYDAASKSAPVELPLWTGLRLQAVALHRADESRALDSSRIGPPSRAPLRDVETALIRQAVADARGNVVQAAKALGISRATVYRKLGQRPG